MSVYRDQAPSSLTLIAADGTASPYLTVSEAITVVPDKLEDAAASTVREHATVDIWMPWKNLVSGILLESYTLPAAVSKALQGSRLLTSGTGKPATTVYAVLVHSVGPRIVEIDDNVVHVPIWVEVWRAL